MDVFDLYAKLSLDSKDYDRSLQQAGDSAEQWKTKMIMAAKAVGTAFTGAVSGISKIIDSSVKAFSNFQQLEGGVQTLFGAGGKSFDEWSKSFTESTDSMQDYVDVARKVINGDFGRGAERKDLLSAAGYDPDTVQQMVNNLINGIDVASGISADTISANMQTAEEKYESLIRAQNNVMENARQAYKTAGLSANDYMNTVTTFTASLIQGLDGDTEKAAQYADRALRDMSDNANKMGTDMSLIMNAYQGFSKQNYTMLDNLKLGYGGTKTEMQRLIKDAAKLTDVQKKLGITVDASSMSFDNIVNAISVMQENMGIAGTTSEEAATTIEGSTKMMKAAWQNMLTAMVTGGDWFEESLDGLVESVSTWAENIMPAVTAAMEGFASLVGKIVPYVASELPGLVEKLLPSFISAISDILNGILLAAPELLTVLDGIIPMVTGELNNLIPSLIDFVLEGIPLVIDAGITLLTGLVSGMVDNVETVVPKLTQGIIDMVDRIIEIVQGGGVGLASAGLALLSGLADALVKAVPNVLTQITQLVQDLTVSIGNAANGEDGNFLTTATTIMKNLVDGLMTSIPTLVPELTSAVAEFITQFADIASKNTVDFTNSAISILNSLVTSLGESGTIESVMTNITTAVMAIIQAIINVITNLDVETFANACASIVGQLADGIVSAIGVITEKLPELITGIVAWLTNPENITGIFEAAITIGGNLIAKVPEILESLASGLAGIVTGIAKYFTDNKDEILQGFKDGFANIGEKMEEIWTEKIKPAFDDLGKKIKEFFSQFEWGAALLTFGQKLKTGIESKWELVKTAFTGENGFGSKVAKWFGELNLLEAGKNLVASLKRGLEEAWEGIKTWFTDKFTHLFDDIDLSKLAFWKKWGKGKNNKEEIAEELGLDADTLIDMPENMITLDYSNLSPIPEDTLASYQQLSEAITSINNAIGGEDGTGGLNSALSGLPALFQNVVTSAQELADYLSGDFISAIGSLMLNLCLTSTDEEGNLNAGGGNTLYNALGSIYGLFEDILATSQLLAGHWNTEFISASQAMRTEAGTATDVVQGLANAAQSAADHFYALTEQIYATVDAYLALLRLKGGTGKGGKGLSTDMFKASGGPVYAGNSYIVGEQGPEVFSPTKSGYITPNKDINKGTQITVNFNGDVIGDEKSISSYVTKAVNRGIRNAVYAAG